MVGMQKYAKQQHEQQKQTIEQNSSTQTRLDKVNWDENIEEMDGDWKKDKKENTTRVMFMNVGGLPTSNYHQKDREIWALVHVKDIDVLGIVEVNTNWTEVLYNHRLIGENHILVGK